MKFLLISLATLVIALPPACKQTAAALSTAPGSPRMDGLSFVAPPRPFTDNPMMELAALGTDWIAVIPYAFSRPGETVVHYSQNYWWGEGQEGAKRTIELANASGIQVMLKPQVWFPDSWPGDLYFEKEEDWENWERTYREYLMPYVELAEQMEVPLFCVGTEFKKSVQPRESFWRALIRDIRKKYSGKLVYAANWDEFPLVPFWDDLDYIGIDAYFPLCEDETPTVERLKAAWEPHIAVIEETVETYRKPVIFTEYGYLSVNKAAYQTWVLEKKRNELTNNEQAQANCYEALFQVFSRKPYWAGGFAWKWYPYESRRGRSRANDYTPQGKMAEEVLKKWFNQPTD